MVDVKEILLMGCFKQVGLRVRSDNLIYYVNFLILPTHRTFPLGMGYALDTFSRGWSTYAILPETLPFNKGEFPSLHLPKT